MQHATISTILLSYSAYKEISQIRPFSHQALIHGFHMTGQGRSPWEPSPPTGEPGPANQNQFFPTKGFIKRQKYSFHQLSGWLVSDDLTGKEAGCGGPGLAWLHVDILPNSLKQSRRRLMVEKWTLNYLATALVDIPAVSVLIAHSLKTWDICGIV
jgi:hypothetical protein